MGKKYYNYGALTVGASFTNAETSKPVAMGATQSILTNGALTVSADAPTGLTNSLQGSSQSVSGTTYITETISDTGVLSVSIYWRMPSSVGTIGAALFWCGSGSTRVAAMSIVSTEQVRLFSASGATLFTSTYTGGFVSGQWYRTDFHITVGTTTTDGRIATATYAEHGTTPLANTSYDSGATVNMGTVQINALRHGTRSSTGTADENFQIRMGYDTDSAYLMGAQSVHSVSAGLDQSNIEPWSTVTLTATSSSGSVAWSQVSGPTVSISGTGLTSTFKAPADFTGGTLVFRATNNTVTDDVSIHYLPATDGIVIGTNPVVVTPIRLTRVG